MITLWKYAENTFEVRTRRSFKLMNILIVDHKTRCAQLSSAEPANQLLTDAFTESEEALSIWQPLYTKWQSCRGQYKGKTKAFHDKLEELSSLKIRQWDAAVQAVFLEGTPEHTALLPQGRAPFQKGAFDQRVSTVRSFSETLVDYAPLAALKTQVDAFLLQLDNLRFAQQALETEVDTCSADLETARQLVARKMYRNLGRFMQLYWDNPVKIEDCYDMNYLRDGATPPPDDEPEPTPQPPVP